MAQAIPGIIELNSWEEPLGLLAYGIGMFLKQQRLKGLRKKKSLEMQIYLLLDMVANSKVATGKGFAILVELEKQKN